MTNILKEYPNDLFSPTFLHLTNNGWSVLRISPFAIAPKWAQRRLFCFFREIVYTSADATAVGFGRAWITWTEIGRASCRERV